MRLLSWFVVSMLCVCLAESPLWAHPGGHARERATRASRAEANAEALPTRAEPGTPSAEANLREWTVAGASSFVASFLAARDGQVWLVRDDGTIVAVQERDLAAADQAWVRRRMDQIARINRQRPATILAQELPEESTVPSGENSGRAARDAEPPAMHRHFLPFKTTLGLRWDDRFYYVESNGMPDHSMMVGIRSWQQQVPLPQSYRGDNAWRIPLQPVPAKRPLSARDNFFRGAIALAVNGVPIFNPIKNDGRTDTFLAGELDEWGGHCGRADDYHYHLAPVHLEKVVGAGQPIAYALDGYAIHGYQDEKSPDFGPLDELNGHKDAEGRYHYHATKKYPYLNGGFHGEVTERDGQVDPQPRAQGPRPAQPPLRGARITDFRRDQEHDEFSVEYEYRGERRAVRYSLQGTRSVTFVYDDGSDGSREERFSLGQEPGRRPRREPGVPRESREPESRGREPSPPGDEPRDSEDRSTQRGPRAGEPRRPWIEVHAGEMDQDGDGVLTWDELREEGQRVFAAYAGDGETRVQVSALADARPVRSAMGGFVREHREEIDRDGDGSVTEDEVLATARRMFVRADEDGDGRVAVEASGNSTRRPPENARAGDATPRDSEQGKPARKRARPGQPNFVFILVDDMGWRDVGYAGNTFVETPHIDRLAAEGVRFTQAYANGPNCAPTRACLMSGQYTPRHGIFTVVDPRHDPGQPNHRVLAVASEESLRDEVVTIAEVLRAKGYATGCLGMWNLGRGRSGPATPTGQGFDLFRKPQDLGFEQNAYYDDLGRNLEDTLFDEGLKFIDAHRDEPFFLYLPTHAVHAPYDPPPRLLKKYRAKADAAGRNAGDPYHAATVEALDANVGRLMEHLRRLELADSTLVVFTSDNGGAPRTVDPLRGSKGSLYEGGIRVPCVVRGAGVRQPGRASDEPILTMDFYPTLAELASGDPDGTAPANVPVAQPLDGVSLLPILSASGPLERDSLFWHFPCYVGRGGPASAVRAGDWKLIEWFEDKSLELYNLRDDPGELRDLADEEPERFGAMRELLRAWQASVKAPLPTALPEQ